MIAYSTRQQQHDVTVAALCVAHKYTETHANFRAGRRSKGNLLAAKEYASTKIIMEANNEGSSKKKQHFLSSDSR